jgi:hypothetical protein
MKWMKKLEQRSSIEFDKKQYEALMRALQIAGSVYDILSDMVDERYDAPADELGDLTSWVLAKAGEFAHKLADREMARRYKKDGTPNLSLEELLDLHIELEEKYAEEFDEHGLDHVEIKED